jgi:hypothetical protein
MVSTGFPNNFHLGDMRFLVTLATRLQTPDSGTSITETFINPLRVYASIKPLGLQTFIEGEQLDKGPTHRILFRWLDNLDYFDVILATIQRPDGTMRQTLYRVFRVTEWEGRQRFTCVDAIEEQRTG